MVLQTTCLFFILPFRLFTYFLYWELLIELLEAKKFIPRQF